MSGINVKRALGTLLSTALITPVVALVGTTTAHADTGSTIQAIALQQIGAGPCSNTDSGATTNGNGGYHAPGSSQINSCSHPGTPSSPAQSGQTQPWCADFAGWTWSQAGVTDFTTNRTTNGDYSLDGLASSFYEYGQRHGTWSSTPHVGDAVYFDSAVEDGHGHVAIVTAVNSDGTFDDVGGNENGTGGWLVQHDVHAFKSNPSARQIVWTENGVNVYLMGFASPAGASTAATVTMSGLATNATYNGVKTVTATTTITPDNSALYLHVDGATYQMSGSGTSYSYPLNANVLAGGSHSVYVSGTFGGSATNSATQTINVAGAQTRGVAMFPGAQAAAFNVGTDKNLHISSQSGAYGAFSSENLGSGTTGGLVGTPSVIMSSSGLPCVFVRTTAGNIAADCQPSAGADMSGGWASVIGSGNPVFAGDPTAVVYPNGAFGVYAIDGSGNIWTSWQSAAGSGFSGWSNLGAGTTGGLVGTPSVTLTTDGLPCAFARTTSGSVAAVCQPAAGAAMNAWSGIGTGNPVFAGDPTSVMYPNGAYGVYAIDGSGNIWTSWQSAKGGGFSAWNSLGNGTTGGLTGTPSVVLSGSNLPCAFARTTTGNVAAVCQPAAGAAMNSWATPLAAGSPTFTGDPVAILYPNGAYGTFGADATGTKWATGQTAAGGGFPGWSSIG